MRMDSEEYLTIVKATINVEIHSDRPLTEEEVQDMLSNASYEIGDNFNGEDTYVFDDEESAYVCGTEWVDSETTRSSAVFDCALNEVPN